MLTPVANCAIIAKKCVAKGNANGESMKYVLVTGAYGGMGYQTVKKFASCGYTVFALDKTVGDAEPNVVPIQADVSDPQQIEQAFKVVQSATDSLFAIVHFAGVYMMHSLVEMPTEQWHKIFQINVFGVFYVNKTFLPLLGRGSKILVTTSELAPLDPLPFTGIYAITKSALDKYAFSLRMELQLLGIDVCVLRAGAVNTGMLGQSTTALDRFVENTQIYQCNAEKFKQIVGGVEAKNIPPQKVANKVYKILHAKKPKFANSINRNKLLLLLNALPHKMQFWAIRKILK